MFIVKLCGMAPYNVRLQNAGGQHITMRVHPPTFNRLKKGWLLRSKYYSVTTKRSKKGVLWKIGAEVWGDFE